VSNLKRSKVKIDRHGYRGVLVHPDHPGIVGFWPLNAQNIFSQ
jgi:hypothetical protein